MPLPRLWTSPLAASLILLAAAGQDSARAQQPVPALENPIVTWTNHYRQRHGLSPLTPNYQLTQMARMHAWHMALREEMAHELEGSTPVERARRAGYTYDAIGENVAYNEGYNDPAWKFFEGWMQSPSHWKNIIGQQYNEIGVGVYRSASGKYYACQVFGSPRGSLPPQLLASLQNPAAPAIAGTPPVFAGPRYGQQPWPNYAAPGMSTRPSLPSAPSPLDLRAAVPTPPNEEGRQLFFTPNYELADHTYYPYQEFGVPNWGEP